MKRILAHKIIYKGIEYNMSVVEIEDGRVLKIEPFETETASTVFISGAVEIKMADGKLEFIRL